MPVSVRPIVRPIIAFASLATAACPCTAFAASRAAAPAAADEVADARVALPALGNTAEGDRPLLREIPDDHVHGRPLSPHGVPVDGDGAPAAVSVPHAASGPAVAAAARPADDAWSRVRASRRLHVPDNEAVRAQRRALRGQALWIGKILRRGDPYVAHVVAALDARYMPLELALLPAIESGFRPHARSPDQATGLWQLMPLTAREIGVRRSDWYDGRADIVVSTTAALDYLSYLNATFHGDWELTLAAYNAGPGRVNRAIRRARAAGRSGDFWSLALPRETREYVPKLLALVALLREEAGDRLDVPHVPNVPAFARVDVGRRISVARAASLGALPETLLRRLNAGLVHGVTPPTGPHELYVPSEARTDFLARLAAAPPGPLHALPDTHVVVAGDTLGALAVAYGVSEERLRALNGLDGSQIRIGQRLAVLERHAAGEASIEHVVASGETLSGIARRYAVGIGAISRHDGRAFDGDVIHPGDTLLVRVPPPSAG